jgi:hypothetical protein
VGLIRKQPKQPKQPEASDWVQPAQLLSQLGTPGPGSALGAPGQTVGPPVPARLRPITATGYGDWLKGALLLAPGSLLWTPADGVRASPVQLAMAMPISGQRSTVDLETPDGRFQLEMDPDLFEMSQMLVAEAAGG